MDGFTTIDKRQRGGTDRYKLRRERRVWNRVQPEIVKTIRHRIPKPPKDLNEVKGKSSYEIVS
jgi:hypothetical protein